MRIKYSHILMWMLIISPIIDNVNGFLLLQGRQSSFSSIFKSLILCMCVFVICKYKLYERDFGNVICILIFCAQTLLFELISPGYLSYNISHVIKLLTPIIITIAFHSLEKNGNDVCGILEKIFEFYRWFFPLSLLIPNLIGIGYTTYRIGLGRKGFYYAGNEISSCMMIILALGIIKYMKERKRIDLINILVIIFACASIATKTSYLVIIFELALVFLLSKDISRKVKRIFLVSIGIVGSGIAIIMKNSILAVIDNWKWTYINRYGNLVSFLLSGRNQKLYSNLDVIYAENGFFKNLLGSNPGWVVQELNTIVEMDAIDLYISFGLVGLICLSLFYIKYVVIVFKKNNLFGMAIILLVYANSFLAGHVIAAPMVNSLLILLCLYFEFQSKDMNKNIV